MEASPTFDFLLTTAEALEGDTRIASKSGIALNFFERQNCKPQTLTILWPRFQDQLWAWHRSCPSGSLDLIKQACQWSWSLLVAELLANVGLCLQNHRKQFLPQVMEDLTTPEGLPLLATPLARSISQDDLVAILSGVALKRRALIRILYGWLDLYLEKDLFR